MYQFRIIFIAHRQSFYHGAKGYSIPGLPTALLGFALSTCLSGWRPHLNGNSQIIRQKKRPLIYNTKIEFLRNSFRGRYYNENKKKRQAEQDQGYCWKSLTAMIGGGLHGKES